MPSAATDSTGDASIQFHLVHAVRGRTRMRVTPPHLADDLARAFARLLRDQPGVKDVQGNVDSGSVVVTYDPDVLDVDRLFRPPPDRAAASWVEDQLARIRGVVTPWTAQLRNVGATVLDRADALWSAGQDQMNAVMSFWSANSVVALSRRLLQTGSRGSVGETAVASER